MFVNVGLVTKRAELNVEEFARTWAGPYAEMILSHSEVRFYVQCIVTDPLEGIATAVEATVPPGPTGIALVGFEDMEAAQQMRNSAAMRAAPHLAAEFCELVVSEFCEVPLRRDIAPSGWASFSSVASNYADPDLELECRALARRPRHFSRVTLHQIELGRSDSIQCDRHVLRNVQR